MLEQFENNYDFGGGTKREMNANAKIETSDSYLSSAAKYLYSFWGGKKAEESHFERRELNSQKFKDTEHIPVVEMPPLPYQAMINAAEHGVCQGASQVIEKVLQQRKSWSPQASRTAAELCYMFSYAAVNFGNNYNKACADGLEGDESSTVYKAAADTCYDMFVWAGTRIVFAGVTKGVECVAEYAQDADWIEPESADWLCFFAQYASTGGAFVQNIITEGVTGVVNIGATTAAGVASSKVTEHIGNTMFSLARQEKVEISGQSHDLTRAFLQPV